jgi:DNA topoisomerase IB
VEKDQLREKYGFAMVDGVKEKVGNYMIEPPGLFRGRGDHPRTGCIKVSNAKQGRKNIMEAEGVGSVQQNGSASGWITNLFNVGEENLFESYDFVKF